LHRQREAPTDGREFKATIDRIINESLSSLVVCPWIGGDWEKLGVLKFQSGALFYVRRTMTIGTNRRADENENTVSY
jgi:hypothetical protein